MAQLEGLSDLPKTVDEFLLSHSRGFRMRRLLRYAETVEGVLNVLNPAAEPAVGTRGRIDHIHDNQDPNISSFGNVLSGMHKIIGQDMVWVQDLSEVLQGQQVSYIGEHMTDVDATDDMKRENAFMPKAEFSTGEIGTVAVRRLRGVRNDGWRLVMSVFGVTKVNATTQEVEPSATNEHIVIPVLETHISGFISANDQDVAAFALENAKLR